MRFSKSLDEYEIGKRMLLNSVKMEESLADILKSEAKVLKKSITEGTSLEDIQRVNKTVKYILFSLTMMDDRIKTGLDLMKQKPLDKE